MAWTTKSRRPQAAARSAKVGLHLLRVGDVALVEAGAGHVGGELLELAGQPLPLVAEGELRPRLVELRAMAHPRLRALATPMTRPRLPDRSIGIMPGMIPDAAFPGRLAPSAPCGPQATAAPLAKGDQSANIYDLNSITRRKTRKPASTRRQGAMKIEDRGYARPEVLVSTDWVAAHLDDPGRAHRRVQRGSAALPVRPRARCGGGGLDAGPQPPGAPGLPRPRGLRGADAPHRRDRATPPSSSTATRTTGGRPTPSGCSSSSATPTPASWTAAG